MELTETRDPGLGIYCTDSAQMLHAAKDGKEAVTGNDGYTDKAVPLPPPQPFGLALAQQDWLKAMASKKQRQVTRSSQLRSRTNSSRNAGLTPSPSVHLSTRAG